MWKEGKSTNSRFFILRLFLLLLLALFFLHAFTLFCFALEVTSKRALVSTSATRAWKM
jgi:cell division protein FtsB